MTKFFITFIFDFTNGDAKPFENMSNFPLETTFIFIPELIFCNENTYKFVYFIFIETKVPAT